MLQTLLSPKLWGKGLKHPVAPSFSGAFERTKDLSGNILRFKAPAPCGDASLVSTDEGFNDTVNMDDLSSYQDLKKVGATADYYLGDALVKTAFLSSWQLNGRPLIDGYMGDVLLNISVRYLPNLPANESLFDKEVFAREIRKETELGSLSDFDNGYNEDEWDFTNTCWPSYIGPLNWQWQGLNSQQWLYYEIQPVNNTSSSHVWNIPLTDNHFLECAFYITKSGGSGGNSYCRATSISSQPYLKLIHQVMSTMTLTRTPELAEREQYVLTDNPNARLLLHPGPSPDQLAFAAHVMWKWSASDMGIEKEDGVDYRAKREDVADLIKNLIEPNPLPGHITSAVFADDFPAGWMFTDGSRFERGN